MTAYDVAAQGEAALQADPLAEEPESPAVAVTRAHRRDLLAVPVERPVILPRLVGPAPLPVAGRAGPFCAQAGVPGRLQSGPGSAVAVPGPTPSSPAIPIPAASADVPKALVTFISYSDLSSVRGGSASPR